MMEVMFKNWLFKRGNKGASNSYPKAIHKISEHYSNQAGEIINIYEVTDQSKISQLAQDYSQSGKFSGFGHEKHGLFRAAMRRYSDFYVESRGEDYEIEGSTSIEAISQEDEPSNNFAYEKDLQTSLCSYISELFPGFRIFGGLGIGVEYAIGGRRIDVLLENENTTDLLIVELKSGEANYKVFGQVSMYISLVKKQFPERNVSGVIVAGSICEGLMQACEITDKVTLKTYRMKLELESA